MSTTEVATTNGDVTARNMNAFLHTMEERIAESAARHINPERMIGVVMTGMLKTPKLLKCSRESVFQAVMEAAQLGLEPTGPQGHAYLVPRWNKNTNGYEATFQFGYKGLISLARRSGRVADIEAHVVHEADAFDWHLGTDKKLEHRPSLEADRGQVTHVYAIAWPSDAGARPIFEVMTREQVEHIRMTSADQKSPAWKNFWGQMARKTVIRRLMNYLDLSPDDKWAEALMRDDQSAYPALHEAATEVERGARLSRTERVEGLLAATDPLDLEGDMPELPVSLGELEELAGIGAVDREAICANLGFKIPAHDEAAYVAELQKIIAETP